MKLEEAQQLAGAIEREVAGSAIWRVLNVRLSGVLDPNDPGYWVYLWYLPHQGEAPVSSGMVWGQMKAQYGV